MLRAQVIAEVAAKQKANILGRSPGMSRLERLGNVPTGFLSVVTGVRRCGKSTLMEQQMRLAPDSAFYLNFESTALAGLELKDAGRIDRAIDAVGAKHLFFDEVQQMKGWERYVRTKLDEGFDVTVTGSNASVFAKELGTKLTGRHVDCELFPFDYGEYLAFVNASEGAGATGEYLRRGGFPAYLASGDERLLETLFEDILVRDVVVRHGIREVDALRRLASYLVENISCRISATRLRQPLSISSTATILKWCDYLSDAYLFDFVPIYSASVKVQMVNPRKAYCIDTGLRHVLSASTAPDDARAFENMVYLALRRVCRDIYYFDEGAGECDFVPVQRKRAGAPVQATVTLNDESEEREINGVRAAMKALRRKTGWIVTLADEDEMSFEEGNVMIVPFHKFKPEAVLTP